MNFHEQWQSKTVKVRSGPFEGWVGTVDGTYQPRVQVVFPVLGPSGLERLWMQANDLEALEDVIIG